MKSEVFAEVAVLAPLETPLTYSVPSAFQTSIQPGQRIVVPLGRRKVAGVVLAIHPHPPEKKFSLKPIEALLEEPPFFNSLQMEFIQWASDYYFIPIGEMFRVAMPAPLARVRPSRALKKNRSTPKSLIFSDSSETPSSDLILTSSQQAIVDEILAGQGFQVHLVHGVTGSGKTEVYLACIQQLLRQGKQVISLVPEIGLTPQTLQRYARHFGNRIGIYHSDLSQNERARIFWACKRGELDMLIGTRSALFAPFSNLGLIVIDEEQDGSYKQEERGRYHARDLAIVRAKMERIPVVLGSATPSLETYAHAKKGKYRYHALTERYGKAGFPEVRLIDLRSKPGEKKIKSSLSPSLLSDPLIEQIQKTLLKKEQTLIFINRRGFAHFLVCQECGEIPLCPHCDITLTYHKRSLKLICHYCDYQKPPPDLCPKCSGSRMTGLGSGTEKIEEELVARFPSARIERMDRDTTRRKGSHEAILKRLAQREIDILVGTQMIAKGHDYPHVTLIGILMADAILHHPDFRAPEETFQMMTQVAGRAGRKDSPGLVLLQTLSPEHYSIVYASRGEGEKFYGQELSQRQELSYPPFSRFMVMRVQGTDPTRVMQGIDLMKNKLVQLKNTRHLNLEILGPAPCLIEKLRNQYRWQILLKYPPQSLPHVFLKPMISSLRNEWIRLGLRLTVDVDPIHVG